jgi:peroxiredoxin
MRQQTAAQFPILADLNHTCADSYRVYNALGDGVAAPAVFVISPAGEIVWSYVGRDAGDRPSAEQILARLP